MSSPYRARAQAEDVLLAAAQAEVDASRKLRHSAATELPAWSPPRDSVVAPQRSTSKSPESISPAPRPLQQDSLEDAVSRARDLVSEINVLRRALEEAELSRRHTQTQWELECQRRQESESHLQVLRQKSEDYVASLESAEHRVRSLSTSIQQLTAELQLSSADRLKSDATLAALRKENHTLSEKVEELAMSSATSERHHVEVASKLEVSLQQSVEWRHKFESLSGELSDTAKRGCAETDLLKAQHAAACASLQLTIDSLHAQLHESTMEAERARSLEGAEYTRVCERLERSERALATANREIDHLTFTLASNAESTSEDLRTKDSQLMKALREVETVSQSFDDMKRNFEDASTKRARLEEEVLELRDVNHILAVRLKSATVEREALEMEREARRLLVRQNEEMERQLVELRRTIQSLMGGNASREAHSVARSIARGTHILGSPN
jgi:chromosome segregation ATPase